MATKPRKPTSRDYFRRLVELTHATADRQVRLLRSLKQAAKTGEFQLEAVYYHSLTEERGFQRLRLCERYFNAGSLGIVKAGFEPYCCSFHSLVLRLWRRIVTEMYAMQYHIGPGRVARADYNPWRVIQHQQGFRDLILWQLDGVPLDEFPAGLHRELHGAEVAIGSQNYTEADERLTDPAWAHWSAVEVHCSFTALKRALNSLPLIGELSAEEIATGWNAFELPLRSLETDEVPFYRFSADMTNCGSWIIDAERACEMLKLTPCEKMGKHHQKLATLSRKWLDGLHAKFPWPLPKPWDKDFAVEWQMYATGLRELPSLQSLEKEWHEYMREIDSAPSALIPSPPASGDSDFDPTQFVTLDQIAAMTKRSKRTLQQWQKKDGTFPLPDIEGGGGTAAYWKWSNIVDYLREKSRNASLPVRFPSFPR